MSKRIYGNIEKKTTRKPDREPDFEAMIGPMIASALSAVEEPGESDVTITLDEYTDLVAQRALLDAVKRMIDRDPYTDYTDMRAVLGMEPPRPADEEAER